MDVNCIPVVAHPAKRRLAESRKMGCFKGEIEAVEGGIGWSRIGKFLAGREGS
jgi:hypothetical protein